MKSTFDFICQLRDLKINLETDGDRLRCHAPEGALTPTLRQEIAKRKTEIISLLQEAKQLKVSEQLSIQPVPRNKELPLSFAQQRLWFLHQLSPDSDSYNMLEALRLDGSLNVVALEQSLSELVQRHEILRTSFPTVDGNPIQQIAPATALTLPIHDLQELSAEEQKTQIRQFVKDFASQSFDLAVGPLVEFALLQLSQNEYVLLLKMHHIIYDGWSLSIFYRELSQLYAAFTQGLPNPLPELPIQYADFAFWQRQWLTGEVLERQLNYWQKQLGGVPGVLELPTDKPRPPIQTFEGAFESFLLDRHLSQRLQKLSQESDATLFMTLLAAFLVLMSRYTGQPDIVVGSPIANRNNPQVEALIGFFANTLALRGDLSDNPSFTDFLAQVRQTTLSAYAHQDLPFEMLVEKLQPERDLSRNPLVQVIFSLQNAPQSSGNLSGLNIQNMALPIDVKARFDLEVNFWEVPGGLEGYWCYKSDLFEAATIRRVAQNFQTLLQAIVANPKARISELPLLSPAEHHQLLVEWNDTQTDYPADQCIHQLFEEQVQRHPDAVAVVFDNQQLTYHQLNCRANSLAHYLRSLGVGADVLVGLCVERSLEMLVALLGILKAGGAYVPLDPEYPTERLQFMLADAQLGVLVTQKQLLDKLKGHQAQVVCWDEIWSQIAENSQDNLTQVVTASDLANVIYTSGSTGKPKGVMVKHTGFVNLAQAQIQTFGLNADSHILQFASLSFDASIWEIIMALASGGTLYLGTKDSLAPGTPLIERLRDYGITHVTLPPSALFVLPAAELPALQTIIVAGEACAPELIKQWSVGRNFFNAYGPTETTVCATIAKCNGDQKISIGRPIANTQIYILDSHLQPVPIGVAGELHIAGVGLARGYLNRPELTNEKFIPNPFATSRGGERLYKTGDLARYLPDGNIEYLGRIDNQVKLRGFRIELGEIEAVLNQHSDVQTSCVIVREDSHGEQRLVAYVVPQPGATLTTTELRQFLANKFPAYMMANAFVILESLPLTPNGKVDRRALKAPTNTSEQDKFIEARNQLELKLVQIWSKVLKTDKVGVQDNFFDLGGHSLLASYLMTQIQQQFGKDIPLTTLFQNPTIEQLATIVQQDLDNSNSSYVVAVQPNGANLPFFCVPGAGGRPFYLYHLGRYLGEDQPLYSFENNLYQQFGGITPIEEIASIYIAAMQTVQPQGPYFLGGHSYGGNVAFEMAQQLRQQGEEVAILAMIDASAPTYKDKQILNDYLNWDYTMWLTEVSKGIKFYLGKEVEISYEILQPLTVEEQLQYLLRYFKMANMLPPNAETTQLVNIVEAYKNSCLCLVDYVPKQLYPGKITILRAKEDMPSDFTNDFVAEISDDFSLGWSEFSTEPVDIRFVLGNHVSIMSEPHVQVLAQELQACLKAAQANI